MYEYEGIFIAKKVVFFFHHNQE